MTINARMVVESTVVTMLAVMDHTVSVCMNYSLNNLQFGFCLDGMQIVLTVPKTVFQSTLLWPVVFQRLVALKELQPIGITKALEIRMFLLGTIW
jgi:hypothetical protein